MVGLRVDEILYLIKYGKICQTALSTKSTSYSRLESCGASQVELEVKNPPANAGDIRDMSSIPGWGRSDAGGLGHPPRHSCLENPMGRGVWRVTVHEVAKSQMWLRDFTGTELEAAACREPLTSGARKAVLSTCPWSRGLKGVRWDVLQAVSAVIGEERGCRVFTPGPSPPGFQPQPCHL